MTVYVLIVSLGKYESYDEVVGIYSSMENAEMARSKDKDLRNENRDCFESIDNRSYEIKSFEIDANLTLPEEEHDAPGLNNWIPSQNALRAMGCALPPYSPWTKY